MIFMILFLEQQLKLLVEMLNMNFLSFERMVKVATEIVPFKSVANHAIMRELLRDGPNLPHTSAPRQTTRDSDRSIVTQRKK